MLEINGKEYSDEMIANLHNKRVKEYAKWRRQKAAEFLQTKKRTKYYHCEALFDPDYENDFYIPLPDKIVARVRALKEEIANDPELKTEEDRADEFRDRVYEIGNDIDVDITNFGGSEWVYTNIDIDDFVHEYNFDIHYFDWKGEKNGKQVQCSVILSDEEYIELLAQLLDMPECSFNHLAYLSPKLKAIHKKLSDNLHHRSWLTYYPGYEHDYAVLMTELRTDARQLVKQLEKKGEQYPHINFLKDQMINIIVAQAKQRNNKPSMLPPTKPLRMP